MRRPKPPLPPPAPCLDPPYPSSQKGGTVVAWGVTDLAEHLRLVADPDGYRLDGCPKCLDPRLHVHDYPRRKPRADPEVVEVKIVRYLCVGCEAVWRVLPQLLARHLWRTWRVVEWSTVAPQRRPNSAPPVPSSTVRRWRTRLCSDARMLTQVLATSGARALEEIAHRVGLLARREDVVLEHARQSGAPPLRWLATLAARVHRLSPGVRVM